MTNLNKMNWLPLGEKLPCKEGEYDILRKWQQEGFHALKSKQYITINAPTGSGKTTLMVAISWAKMLKDVSLRVAIAAPQTIIANNFAERKFVLPGTNEKVDWVPANNLCNDAETHAGTIKLAIDWLKKPAYPYAKDQICIAANATWIACYHELKKQNNLHLLDNLLLWADEAQHIKNALWESEELGIHRIISNELGELVHYLSVAEKKRNIHVGIASATLFRGDRLTLLVGEALERFNGKDGGRFDLPWDRYLSEMVYLKSFCVDFVLCGSDYIPAIKGLLKEAKRKDIVYIPHPSSKISTGEKYAEAENVICCYHKAHGGSRQHECGLDVFVRPNNESVILNLVDESERAEKKDYIRQVINKDRKNLDAIIAINMFKEGADWVFADRSIVIGSRSSIVDIIQMYGRLFRDVAGKEEVQVVYLLPFSLDRVKLTADEFADKLNDFLKFVMASMLASEIIKPKLVPSPESNNPSFPKIPKASAYDDLTTDQQIALRAACTDFFLKCSDQQFANGDAYEAYESMFPSLLSKLGIHVSEQTEVKEIAKKVWTSIPAQAVLDEGKDLSDVPFDIMKRTNPLGFLLRYTTEACGIETWQELKEALQTNGKISTPQKQTEEIAQSSVVSLDEKTKEAIRRLL